MKYLPLTNEKNEIVDERKLQTHKDDGKYGE